MRHLLIALCLMGSETPALAAPHQLTLRASDGLPVSGTYFPGPAGAPLILLFHQAYANRAEYASIAPRLVQTGYACLAIDQRSGDGMFDSANQTAASYTQKTGQKADYRDALPDLEAALAWGHAHARRVYVLGSSYSASLVFLLADRHPKQVDAVLAFSPDPDLFSKEVPEAAKHLTMPVFVTSDADPQEELPAKRILDLVRSTTKTQFIAKTGVHRASVLIQAGTYDPEPYWWAMLTFLRALPR